MTSTTLRSLADLDPAAFQPAPVVPASLDWGDPEMPAHFRAKRSRPFPQEDYKTRSVSRLINRALHVEGQHASNFAADVADMLLMGYGLTPKDFRFLRHVGEFCVRNADNAEGVIVSMSDRQWGMFVSTRRKFLRSPAYFIHRITTRRLAETNAAAANN